MLDSNKHESSLAHEFEEQIYFTSLVKISYYRFINNTQFAVNRTVFLVVVVVVVSATQFCYK